MTKNVHPTDYRCEYIQQSKCTQIFGFESVMCLWWSNFAVWGKHRPHRFGVNHIRYLCTSNVRDTCHRPCHYRQLFIWNWHEQNKSSFRIVLWRWKIWNSIVNLDTLAEADRLLLLSFVILHFWDFDIIIVRYIALYQISFASSS